MADEADAADVDHCCPTNYLDNYVPSVTFSMEHARSIKAFSTMRTA